MNSLIKMYKEGAGGYAVAAATGFGGNLDKQFLTKEAATNVVPTATEAIPSYFMKALAGKNMGDINPASTELGSLIPDMSKPHEISCPSDLLDLKGQYHDKDGNPMPSLPDALTLYSTPNAVDTLVTPKSTDTITYAEQRANIKQLAEQLYGPKMLVAVEKLVEDSNSTSNTKTSVRDTLMTTFKQSGVPPKDLDTGTVAERKAKANKDANEVLSLAILSELVRDPAQAESFLRQIKSAPGNSMDVLQGNVKIQSAIRELTVKATVQKALDFLKNANQGIPETPENIKALSDWAKHLTVPTPPVPPLAPTAPVLVLKDASGNIIPQALLAIDTTKRGTTANLLPPATNLSLITNIAPTQRIPNIDLSKPIFEGLLPVGSTNPGAEAENIIKSTLIAAQQGKNLAFFRQGLGVLEALTRPNNLTVVQQRLTAFEASTQANASISATAKKEVTDTNEELKTAEQKSGEEVFKATFKALSARLKADFQGARSGSGSEIAGFKDADFDAIIRDVEQNGLTQAHMERLSALTIGIKNPVEAQKVSDSLKAMAILASLDQLISNNLGNSNNPRNREAQMLTIMDLLKDPNQRGATIIQIEKLLTGDSQAQFTIPANILNYVNNKVYNPPIAGQIAIPQFAVMPLKEGTVLADRIHNLFAPIRRGMEAQKIYAMKGKTEAEIKQFLTTELGLQGATPEELQAAYERFNKVIAQAGTPGFPSLAEIVKAGVDGTQIDGKDNLTNFVRFIQNYIKSGLDPKEQYEKGESLTMQELLKNVAAQTNGKVLVNGREVPIERVIEITKGAYENLGPKKTRWESFRDAISSPIKAIAKMAVFALAVSAVSSILPGVALVVGPIFAAVGLYRLGKDGIKNQFKDLKSRPLEVLGMAALNAVVFALAPWPASTIFSIVESMAIEGIYGYKESKLAKELKSSHAAWDTAVKTKLNDAKEVNPQDQRLIAALAQIFEIKMSNGQPVDVYNLRQAEMTYLAGKIVEARDNARKNPDQNQGRRKLAEFSIIMEQILDQAKADFEKQNKTYADAKSGLDDSKQAVQWGMRAGVVLGGAYKTVSNLYDKYYNNKDAGKEQESQKGYEEKVDKRTQELGGTAQDTHVVATTKTHVLVDANGDNTPDMAIPKGTGSELDFSHTKIFPVSANTTVTSTPFGNATTPGLEIRPIQVLTAYATDANIKDVSVEIHPTGTETAYVGTVAVPDSQGIMHYAIIEGDNSHGYGIVLATDHVNTHYNIGGSNGEQWTVQETHVDHVHSLNDTTGHNTTAIVVDAVDSHGAHHTVVIDPATGHQLGPVVDSQGHTITPDYGSGTGSGVEAGSSSYSYALKDQEGLWVATRQILHQIYGDKVSEQDVADMVHEAEARGADDQLHQYFTENVHPAHTAFRIGDTFTAEQIKAMAPDKWDQIVAHTGINPNLSEVGSGAGTGGSESAFGAVVTYHAGSPATTITTWDPSTLTAGAVPYDPTGATTTAAAQTTNTNPQAQSQASATNTEQSWGDYFRSYFPAGNGSNTNTTTNTTGVDLRHDGQFQAGDLNPFNYIGNHNNGPWVESHAKDFGIGDVDLRNRGITGYDVRTVDASGVEHVVHIEPQFVLKVTENSIVRFDPVTGGTTNIVGHPFATITNSVGTGVVDLQATAYEGDLVYTGAIVAPSVVASPTVVTPASGTVTTPAVTPPTAPVASVAQTQSDLAAELFRNARLTQTANDAANAARSTPQNSFSGVGITPIQPGGTQTPF